MIMGSVYEYEDYSGFIVTSKSKELENTCGGFSTDAVSMDHPRRNLPPSRRKIDVDKNNSNQTEFRMPFLITGQAIDWYRSLNIEDMLNAASPGTYSASNELDQLKERMEKVLNVFSEVDTTEFVIEQTRVLRLIQGDTKHLTRDILNSCCYKKQLHGWYELYSDN
ncbi:unnamed protein product [Brassica oleracea var. botrytis]